MGIIITLAFLGILAALFLFFAIRGKGKSFDFDGGTRVRYSPGLYTIAVLLAITFSLVFLFNSYTSVPSRSVAVETSFGQSVGAPLKSGFHWIRPWAQTEDFTLMVQKSERLGGDAINVKLKGGANGQVSAIVRYHTDEIGATKQWRNYGSFDNMKKTLIMSLESDSFNAVYGNYEPMDAQNGVNRAEIEKQLKDKLSTALQASGIDFDGVSIVKLSFDSAVQKNIDDQISQKQKTAIALEAIQTAKNQQQANARLAEKLTPDVVTQNCLNMTDKNISANHSFPAGWTCVGNTNTSVPLK